MRQILNTAARRLPTWPVYMVGAVPLVWLLWGAVTNSLGPDPVKALEHGLGLWSLRLLMASLSISPLMRIGVRLLKFRRALGLWGFGYATLHFTTWLTLDMGLRWSEIATDLSRRPYIIVGLLALILLVPLAATSWNGAIRRMGPPRWSRLHRLAYPAILAGAVHFVMVGKVWTGESLIYLGLTLVLLLFRMPQSSKLRTKTA